VEKPSQQAEGQDDIQPTELAIGVEGGFSTEDEKYEIVTQYSIVVMAINNDNPFNPSIVTELVLKDDI
jgi:hypothetical protein